VVAGWDYPRRQIALEREEKDRDGARGAMTLWRVVHVSCDGCGVIASLAVAPTTFPEARSLVQAAGWHVVSPGGRDVCPDCWTAGVRGPISSRAAARESSENEVRG